MQIKENRDIRAAGHPGADSLPEDNRLAVGYHICVRGVVSESVLYPRKSPKLGRLVGGYLTPGEAVADSMFDLPSKGWALSVQIRCRIRR